jgi:hypothetical protein
MMMWTRARRRVAVTVACVGTVLGAPTGAMGLTTHSATTSTKNSAGQLVATAKCGASEHVASGGFNASEQRDSDGAVVSRAVHGDSWTVRLYPTGSPGVTLTTFAYCARTGGVSTHEHQVMARAGNANTTATARCASGQTLVSGGYAFMPSSGQFESATYRDFAASTGAWRVMSAFIATPAKLAAIAYCQRGVIVKVRSVSSGLIPHAGYGSATASSSS